MSMLGSHSRSERARAIQGVIQMRAEKQREQQYLYPTVLFTGTLEDAEAFAQQYAKEHELDIRYGVAHHPYGENKFTYPQKEVRLFRPHDRPNVHDRRDLHPLIILDVVNDNGDAADRF